MVTKGVTSDAHFKLQRLTCKRCTRRLGWKYTSLCRSHTSPHHPPPPLIPQLSPREDSPPVLSPGDPELSPQDDSSPLLSPHIDVEESETRTVDWAASNLEEDCLYKSVGKHTVRYCHKRSVDIQLSTGEQLTLGTYNPSRSISQQAEPNIATFGKLPYHYIPFAYTEGYTCNAPQTSKANVMLICCDSYNEGEAFEDEDLRIELYTEVGRCAHDLFICVPRLCFVQGYEHPDVVGNVDAELDDIVHQVQHTDTPQPCGIEKFFSLMRQLVLIQDSQEYLWIHSIQPTNTMPWMD